MRSTPPPIPPQCRIIGFMQDEEQQWIAVLECGHTQHVRHNPPWEHRGWVTTEVGRTSFIGRTLPCKACLPAGFPTPNP